LAEQSMAVSEFILAGMAISAVLHVFALRKPEGGGAGWWAPGRRARLAIAWASNLIEASSSVSPAARSVWIVLLLVAWGAALGWVYQRQRRDEAAAASGESAAASAAERAHRRRFLTRFAGIASVITVVAAAVGKVGGRRETAVPTKGGEPWSATHPLPNAGAVVQTAAGTRPELTPVSRHYRIDINTSPPSIPEASWRLKIHGLVAKPLEWTLGELRARPAMHQFITLSCISNTVGGDLIGTTRWSGVSLQQLLPEVGLHPNATHLKIHSTDGFYEVVALDAIREDGRVMLTYAWDGLPLPEKHGFPLRIYIPDRYGMKQPKWIESIEAIDHWEAGYWVVRGWDREARMKATSVIDTIATNMMMAQPTREMRVPIGGIAHAGIRGISKVELRVDSGEWMPAELRTPLSGQTWVVWRCDWPMHRGKHTFTVRCFEGDGTPQIAREAPPDPSGASGLDTRSVML
jgi:sulfite oxidase